MAIEKNFINKYIIKSALIWTVLAHGMVFFNKYSYHDDAAAFNSVGRTFNLGRWMLGILGEITRIFFGGKHYSLPIVHGALSVCCIVIMLHLLINRIELKSKTIIILLTGVFISFPAVTCIFGFMFTSSYYFVGMLFGVLGAYYYYEKKTIFSLIVCTICMACSVGVYQANIPVCICSLLIFMIDDIYKHEYKWTVFWKEAGKNIAICLMFMGEYLIINKLFLKFLKIELENYKGLNNYGITTVGGYILRVVKAYREFLYPSRSTMANMFHYNARVFNLLLIIVVAIIFILFIRRVFSINKQKAIQLCLLFFIFPLAAFFIFVMADLESISGLMTYGEVFIFLLIGWLLEKGVGTEKKLLSLKKVALLLVGVILLFDIRFSNICYIKQGITQSQMISYFTTLSTQIKSTPGYSDETPVVYINELKKHDESAIGSNYMFDDVNLTPYNMPEIINDYAWRDFMRQWVGFNPHIGDESLLEGNADIDDMPCYPDDGSIRYIDGQIVVKFSN